MKILWLLLKPRLLGAKNRLLTSRGGGFKRFVLIGVFGGGFWIGAFVISCRILIHFRSAEVIGEFLARYMLSVILLTLFSLLIFSHIVTALSNLYLSRDLELCRSAPVSLETLFVSRAIYTLVDSSWMLVVFGFPVFAAYGYVYSPGPWFYGAVLHLGLAMAVIAGGIGILLSMVLVRVFPARKTRDLLILLSILTAILLYLLFRFVRPERLVNPDAYFTIAQYAGALKAPLSPYLPTQWIADHLWSYLSPAGKGGVFDVLTTWSTACALGVMNLWTASFLYGQGLSKSQEAKERRLSGKRLLDWVARSLSKPFGEQLGAVAAKDIRTFFRDNAQWSQLLLLAALVVVYVYNFTVLPLDKSPIQANFLHNELAFLNMGLAGFVLSAVCARFVFPTVSSEGEAYWILRSSPLRLRRYLWGKHLFFLLPMVLLAELLIIGTNTILDVTPFMMVLTATTMLFMVFGLVSLAVGLGALYPDFRHENPARLSTGFGGLMYMLASAVFIGLIILLEAGPAYVMFVSDARGEQIRTWQWGLMILCFLAIVGIHALVIWKPMEKGLRHLRVYDP